MTAQPAKLRRLGPEDWELLREVRLLSLADAPAAFGSTYAREADFDEAEWRRRAADNGWFLATASEAGLNPAAATGSETVLGIVAGYHDDSSPREQRHLVAMWVAPAARGSGVAVELVEAVTNWSRDDGATEVTLGVADGNERARALYVKCGFIPTGESFPLHSDPTRNIEIYARSI